MNIPAGYRDFIREVQRDYFPNSHFRLWGTVTYSLEDLFDEVMGGQEVESAVGTIERLDSRVDRKRERGDIMK